MERKLHLLESFNARDAQGQTYKVMGYEHLMREELFVDAQDHWESTGKAEYRLDSGERVDALPDGSLRIAATGVVLTRH